MIACINIKHHYQIFQRPSVIQRVPGKVEKSETKHKKGFLVCGICNERFSHLERHVLRKHNDEPFIKEMLNLPKLKYDKAWKSVKENWQHNASEDQNKIICQCGVGVKKISLKPHLAKYCSESPTNIKEVFASLTRNDNPCVFSDKIEELFEGEKRDDIWRCGSSDPSILIRIELDSCINIDRKRVMGKFRILAKYLHCFQILTSNMNTAVDMLNIKHYPLLKEMGQGKTSAPIDAKKAFKTLPAALSCLSEVALKTLREKNGSVKLIKQIKTFAVHVRKWWYKVSKYYSLLFL